jgi:uncharacterized protein
MRIEHEEKQNKGAFFVEANGKRIAELLYFHPGPGRINIYHTEVDQSLRGKGVAGDLVDAAVKFARENEKKIIATCPYARKVIDSNAEYGDLLVEE